MATTLETPKYATAAGDTELQPVHASSCTECQRRKQKCDRKWPCNGCRKRNVSEHCWYPQDHHPRSGWNTSEKIKRKREERVGSVEVTGGDNGDDWLEAIGYTSEHPLALLGADTEASTVRDMAKVPQYMLDPESSPQLKRALDAIPSEVYMDSLIQHFLSSVNFYYYILYPKSFYVHYETWQKQRKALSTNKSSKVGIQFTCLLIMILSCSIQHADDDLAKKIEAGLGKDVKTLTTEYHDIARELHAVLPVDQSHVFSIQYLLHSCYWYKAEAKFADCWHMLGFAVREGQRLGLHMDDTVAKMSDFDREMSRRLWCILDAWDWLVSALLARPMLIDRTDCTAVLPALTLEPYPVSPLLHIKLQSDLIGRIFSRFGPPKNITALSDIQDYEDILDRWIDDFPQAFRFDNTNFEHEIQYPWIQLHRHYTHVTGLSLALGPLKQFMIKPTVSTTPVEEVQLRNDGIRFALRLNDSVHGFFDYVWTRDTTFHFVPFCIFDTALHLVHALDNDKNDTMGDSVREECLVAIRRAITTLTKLSAATETAQKPKAHLIAAFEKVEGRMEAKKPKVWHPEPRAVDVVPTIPVSNSVQYQGGDFLATTMQPEVMPAYAPTGPVDGSFTEGSSVYSSGGSGFTPTMKYEISPQQHPIMSTMPAADPVPQMQYGMDANFHPSQYIGMDLLEQQVLFNHEQQMAQHQMAPAPDHGYNGLPETDIGHMSDLWGWQNLG